MEEQHERSRPDLDQMETGAVGRDETVPPAVDNFAVRHSRARAASLSPA